MRACPACRPSEWALRASARDTQKLRQEPAQEPPLHPHVLLQERPQLWLGHQVDQGSQPSARARAGGCCSRAPHILSWASEGLRSPERSCGGGVQQEALSVRQVSASSGLEGQRLISDHLLGLTPHPTWCWAAPGRDVGLLWILGCLGGERDGACVVSTLPYSLGSGCFSPAWLERAHGHPDLCTSVSRTQAVSLLTEKDQGQSPWQD